MAKMVALIARWDAQDWAAIQTYLSRYLGCSLVCFFVAVIFHYSTLGNLPIHVNHCSYVS